MKNENPERKAGNLYKCEHSLGKLNGQHIKKTFPWSINLLAKNVYIILMEWNKL